MPGSPTVTAAATSPFAPGPLPTVPEDPPLKPIDRLERSPALGVSAQVVAPAAPPLVLPSPPIVPPAACLCNPPPIPALELSASAADKKGFSMPEYCLLKTLNCWLTTAPNAYDDRATQSILACQKLVAKLRVKSETYSAACSPLQRYTELMDHVERWATQVEQPWPEWKLTVAYFLRHILPLQRTLAKADGFWFDWSDILEPPLFSELEISLLAAHRNQTISSINDAVAVDLRRQVRCNKQTQLNYFLQAMRGDFRPCLLRAYCQDGLNEASNAIGFSEHQVVVQAFSESDQVVAGLCRWLTELQQDVVRALEAYDAVRAANPVDAENRDELMRQIFCLNNGLKIGASCLRAVAGMQPPAPAMLPDRLLEQAHLLHKTWHADPAWCGIDGAMPQPDQGFLAQILCSAEELCAELAAAPSLPEQAAFFWSKTTSLAALPQSIAAFERAMTDPMTDVLPDIDELAFNSMDFMDIELV
jgi:hypothetical protein